MTASCAPKGDDGIDIGAAAELAARVAAPQPAGFRVWLVAARLNNLKKLTGAPAIEKKFHDLAPFDHRQLAELDHDTVQDR